MLASDELGKEEVVTLEALVFHNRLGDAKSASPNENSAAPATPKPRPRNSLLSKSVTPLPFLRPFEELERTSI